MADAADPTPDEPVDAPRSWKDAWPFLVALAVVVVLLAGIGLSYVLRPAEERAGDSAQVQYAINDIYTARNDLDYGKYRAGTCAADVAAPGFIGEVEFLEQNRKTFAENGHLVIPEITDLVVNEDQASAKVHWHYDRTPDRRQVTSTTLIRESGKWKVCNS